MKKKTISLLCALVLLSGCGQTEPSAVKQESGGTQTAQAETSQSDIVEGKYIAQAVMMDGKLYSFKDNPKVADLYDNNWVVVNNDGTFGIQNGVIWATGNWDRIKVEKQDNAYLFAQKQISMGAYGSHNKPSESEKSYLSYLTNGDRNTFIMLDVDDKEHKSVLVYVREGKESAYLQENETASSSSSSTSSQSSSSSHSSSSSNSSSHSSSSSSSSSYSGTITSGKRNAAQRAQDYIKYMAFSRKGLIEQLEYEGFSHSEAEYGADSCGADWYEQAVKKAEDYLDVMSFSSKELYEQLLFEGFTEAEAEYGVETAY